MEVSTPAARGRGPRSGVPAPAGTLPRSTWSTGKGRDGGTDSWARHGAALHPLLSLWEMQSDK